MKTKPPRRVERTYYIGNDGKRHCPTHAALLGQRNGLREKMRHYSDEAWCEECKHVALIDNGRR